MHFPPPSSTRSTSLIPYTTPFPSRACRHRPQRSQPIAPSQPGPSGGSAGLLLHRHPAGPGRGLQCAGEELPRRQRAAAGPHSSRAHRRRERRFSHRARVSGRRAVGVPLLPRPHLASLPALGRLEVLKFTRLNSCLFFSSLFPSSSFFLLFFFFFF